MREKLEVWHSKPSCASVAQELNSEFLEFGECCFTPEIVHLHFVLIWKRTKKKSPFCPWFAQSGLWLPFFCDLLCHQPPLRSPSPTVPPTLSRIFCDSLPPPSDFEWQAVPPQIVSEEPAQPTQKVLTEPKQKKRRILMNHPKSQNHGIMAWWLAFLPYHFQPLQSHLSFPIHVYHAQFFLIFHLLSLSIVTNPALHWRVLYIFQPPTEMDFLL